MPKETYIEFCVSGVIGTREHIKRLLEVKGMSPIVINEIIEKIERIIELSGKLGRQVQREKDLKELSEMKEELRKYEIEKVQTRCTLDVG